MARGLKTSFAVSLSPEVYQELRKIQRASTVSAGFARRARIILLLADRRSITAIAQDVGMSRRHVYKWIRRFIEAQSIQCLRDKEGRGLHSHKKKS